MLLGSAVQKHNSSASVKQRGMKRGFADSVAIALKLKSNLKVVVA